MMTPLTPRDSGLDVGITNNDSGNKHSILFQQNWSGCPGRDMVVLLLQVYRFFRLFLLCAEEKVFSSLDPSRGSSRRFAHRRLVWAKSKQNGMRVFY